MKHAILGAGAIGGLMATALSSVGEDVLLIVRAEKLAAQPSSLSVQYPGGMLIASLRVAGRVEDAVDVLWVATKTYQLAEALHSVKVDPGMVVPLLNGVDHVAFLRARFGEERVVPGTIAVEAERSAPGQYIQHNAVRLNAAARGESVLGGVFEKLRSLGWTCKFIASESTLLWTKLCFLGPFALVTSASGMDLGHVLADPNFKERFESAISEAGAVAAKEGAQVDYSGGTGVFAAFAPSMRASMAKDLAAGRPLELDGIAGAIVRGGKKHGLPTPTTSALVSMIEEKERAATK